MSSISVCMASYNGGKYIEEQIDSILNQLGDSDELVVVDDCSVDDTVEKIKSYKDDRIKVYQNKKNIGVNKTFERAMSLAVNDYIFLSDQDDIWLSKRVDNMLSAIENAMPVLVSTRMEYIDASGRDININNVFLKSEDSKRYLNNIIKIFTGKAAYYGCAMVLNRGLLFYVLPFPSYIESHDLWIAMTANYMKANVHCDCYTLKRRIHGCNASVISRSIMFKVKARAIFLISFLHIVTRIIKNKYIKRICF